DMAQRTAATRKTCDEENADLVYKENRHGIRIARAGYRYGDLPQDISSRRLRLARVTRAGIAANSGDIRNQPGAFAKLSRYSGRDNPCPHQTPTISAGSNIPSATKPNKIVEAKV